MKKTSTIIAICMFAQSGFAASTENAQAYLDRVSELTDYTETAKITAEQVIESWATMGLTFNEENTPKAMDILVGAFEDVLPEAVNKTLPVIEEVYTDEELEAALEFMETDAGAAFMSKGGIAGGKSAIYVQEEIVPIVQGIMPEIMGLIEQ